MDRKTNPNSSPNPNPSPSPSPSLSPSVSPSPNPDPNPYLTLTLTRHRVRAQHGAALQRRRLQAVRHAFTQSGERTPRAPIASKPLRPTVCGAIPAPTK
eukprot:scaffold20766_cov54-Phaeocystis_antarctica.AAC.1